MPKHAQRSLEEISGLFSPYMTELHTNNKDPIWRCLWEESPLIGFFCVPQREMGMKSDSHLSWAESPLKDADLFY